jgi:hypothetical protein
MRKASATKNKLLGEISQSYNFNFETLIRPDNALVTFI